MARPLPHPGHINVRATVPAACSPWFPTKLNFAAHGCEINSLNYGSTKTRSVSHAAVSGGEATVRSLQQ